MKWSIASAPIGRLVLIGALAIATANARADCQSEIRILADDLSGLKLTSAQSQMVADKVLQARRHCWIQREQAAMDLINSARRIAGIKEATGKFDWENVPLKSLENQ